MAKDKPSNKKQLLFLLLLTVLNISIISSVTSSESYPLWGVQEKSSVEWKKYDKYKGEASYLYLDLRIVNITENNQSIQELRGTLIERDYNSEETTNLGEQVINRQNMTGPYTYNLEKIIPLQIKDEDIQQKWDTILILGYTLETEDLNSSCQNWEYIAEFTAENTQYKVHIKYNERGILELNEFYINGELEQKEYLNVYQENTNSIEGYNLIALGYAGISTLFLLLIFSYRKRR